ncbi:MULTISPECIES: response regulator [Dyella]|uniref:histidine kinase n=2 Tax=Dyella TaxID=231454 RepID=A0A4R0YS00_9GAMM|nr:MULTISPECIES: response regulator [Dyella]TBR40315.1 response regulator [Dyella terrae]TCI12103.1 response regulator [Dyella soli]
MASPTNKYSWLAHQPIQRKIMVAIGGLIAIFTACSIVSLVSITKQKESWDWTRHTFAVQLKLDDVVQSIQESQAGARGYLLTRNPVELDDFTRAGNEFDNHLAELRKLTSDNPLQQTRIDRLQSMATQWRLELNRNGVVPMEQLTETDPAAAALARQNIQSTYMAARTVRMKDILTLADQVDATEQDLLDAREKAQRSYVFKVEAAIWFTMLLSLILGASVVVMTYRLVTRPLRRMTDLMTRLASHDHTVEIRRLERRDEIGEIARALHVFKQMEMETSAQTWVKSNVSKIAGELQTVSTTREFAERLTGTLAPLVEAGVAVFYGWDDADNALRLEGSYGFQERKHLSTRYALGEGLVGQCAVEHKPITLQEVPDDYIRIHSGTGEASPRSIVVLPLMLRDRLLGVLELACFHHLTESEQGLLNELLPIAALSLENIGRAIRTQDLLHRTSEQADELRTSEEALRRQQQDLQATNEELNARTQELQEQSQRLLASEEELRVQTEELQASNEELRQKTDTLNQQKGVLESLQKETQEKAEELARASQYKSEFLANMSHELRTPLNSLLILSRSLSENREGNLDDEQIESARIIHDSGSNLLRLINDILDLSKVEAGKMELSPSDFPLADLERTLGRTFNHVAQEKQLDFRIIVEPGLPASLFTDASKLEQIANNLIGNAFKFTHEGRVEVRIGRPEATIALPPALQGKPAVAIGVTDSGIGIPAHKLQRIFQAFEQVDASTSRQYGGTGLGLTISRRIAELLGGDIVVHSTEGQGSTFTILLPERIEGQVDTLPPAAPAPAPMARPHTTALLPDTIDDDRDTITSHDTVILIIEDDPVFARILADMVHRKGYRVLAAGDGESGIQLAATFRPTGILLDVMLPGMDGWTVIAQLKDNSKTRHIPVHFISAVDEAGRGRDLGAVGFLTKPVSREAIGEAFDRLMHFAEGQERQLLIVDDDADSRAAMRTLLKNKDIAIDEVGTAEEALERTASAHYDCIVLDLGLPGMSGIEFLEKVAATGSVPPVVVYSGRELSREESLKLRQYTDSIVIKGARSPERLLDEVSLFLHSFRDGRATSPAATPAAPSGHELRDRKVLLVDDDMRNLFALSKVLRGWGMHVAMAQDGQKALKALGDQSDIELVLMDVMMPVMDGYDTIREIRAQARYARLPIIALTAKAMRGDREKCLEAGANDYLSKPIDIDKLSSMMRVWLHQ